jgi:heterodisulfide reductase subunit A
MGVEFIKGKVAKITEDEEHNPIVRVEMMEDGARVVERKHDLVILSVGLMPGYNPQDIYGVGIAEDGFVRLPSANMAPSLTDQEGIFAAGTASGPMDIVDSILMAGAAAAEASAYLKAQQEHPKEDSTAPVRAQKELAHV